MRNKTLTVPRNVLAELTPYEVSLLFGVPFRDVNARRQYAFRLIRYMDTSTIRGMRRFQRVLRWLNKNAGF